MRVGRPVRRAGRRNPSFERRQGAPVRPYTRLLGPKPWTYFYLYVLLDIFSRYVVGWMVAERESSALAARLIEQTCLKQGIEPLPRRRAAQSGRVTRRRPTRSGRLLLGGSTPGRRLRTGTARPRDPAPRDGPTDRARALPSVQMGRGSEAAPSGLLPAPGHGTRVARIESRLLIPRSRAGNTVVTETPGRLPNPSFAEAKASTRGEAKRSASRPPSAAESHKGISTKRIRARPPPFPPVPRAARCPPFPQILVRLTLPPPQSPDRVDQRAGGA